MGITNFDTSNQWLIKLGGTFNSPIEPPMVVQIFNSISQDITNNTNLLLETLNNYSSNLQTYADTTTLIQTLTQNQAASQKDSIALAKESTTNDRKSFYEAQQIGNLLSWHTKFRWIYFICAIIFIIAIFISENSLSFTYKVVFSVIVILYPFLINYILKPVLFIYHFIYDLIPKNVYNSI